MHRVGFGLCVAFLVGVVGIRGLVSGELGAELRSTSRWFHFAATIITGGFTLALRRRRALSYDTLEWVDAVGIVALGALLNLNAGLFGIRSVAVFNLVLTTGLAAVLRAIVVPSTARRTLVLGGVSSGLAITIFFVSAHPAWPVAQVGPPDWPLAFQLISLVMWLGALVATATVASRVIFGLRHEVRAARKLGQYVLGAKIGEGGMGVVYRATHAMLRRETALKLLPPDRIDEASVRRFEREVVATARLRHPNTIAIFDYGRTPDGIFYYAMEYLDGLTLSELVERTGPLPPARAIAILVQVCASLDEAHSLGLIHRDIKPSNIMVNGHPGAFDLVKVLDFGLVKSTQNVSHHSSVDTLTGTPLYMAPESIREPDGAEARSDLYAVAAVAYFLLTGHHVFEASTIVEIAAAHLHEIPVPLSERAGRAIPADLDALVMRGLAKDKAARPQTADDFRRALLACDVARWSDDDARVWWTTVGTQLGPRLAPLPSRDLAHAPTISVVLDRGT